MSDPVMPTVEPRGVTQIEPLHRPTEMNFDQLDQQIIVIVHQHVAVDTDAKTINQSGKQFQKVASIAIIPKDGPPFIAAPGDMVKAANIFNPQGSSHGKSLCRHFALRQMLNVKM
jgi:hypothetical protein